MSNEQWTNMQGCGLRKITRSPKVPNHEILGAQHSIGRSTENWGEFQILTKWINLHYHMKDHVEIDHLTKYDAFRVNRDY